MRAEMAALDAASWSDVLPSTPSIERGTGSQCASVCRPRIKPAVRHRGVVAWRVGDVPGARLPYGRAVLKRILVAHPMGGGV